MIVTLCEHEEDPFLLPLVDFHTHIGRVKIETTKGASQRVNRPQDIINLYEKLQYELHKRVTQDQSEYYVTLPPAEELSKPLFPAVEQLLNFKSVKPRGWLVDGIVAFPFNDIFHLQTNPKFVKSNQYVRHQIYSFAFSFRFIPFCRVDVTDDGASEEVRKSVNLGMRGLKLHPMSQGWIENIVTPHCKEVLKTAGELSIPIIFDVPNKGVACDITTIAEETRGEVSFPINIVLGHTAFDYSSPELFICLMKNGMFAETSGMRGKDVEIFFTNLLKNEVNKWENKILFGTDHNYFSVLQAADFITFLFSWKFKELLSQHDYNGSPLEIAAKILGGNALKIIRPSWRTSGENITPRKLENNGYSASLSTLYSGIKKFLGQENNYSVFDLIASLNEENLSIQVLTIGGENRKRTFILQAKENYQKIFLLPLSDNL
ncbi:MAG: hypothetical protein JSV04_15515, partial [Candidatus Heimdallarchaeota archaeon]